MKSDIGLVDDIHKYIGKPTLTVAEAMRQIDNNLNGILFIADDENRLMGCVADGDIRRFLLAGGNLDACVMNAANKEPKCAKSAEDAKELYIKPGCNYKMIPVISDNGRIVGLYNDGVGEPKQRSRLNVPVVINAGGRGTRLDPFTRVLPKPLIPVGDMPIIEHIMKEYQTYSCNDFHIIVNYKRELVKAYFAENENRYKITWHDEKKPLGTGGGLSLLRGRFADTFFFANCDALLTANYESMLKFHKQSGNVITMICAYKNISVPYGVIEMGENGAIVGMQEKPVISFLANTGIYIVEPDVINDIEDDVAVGFPEIVERERMLGKRVAVFPVGENDWMDMGQLPELEQMRIRMYGE